MQSTLLQRKLLAPLLDGYVVIWKTNTIFLTHISPDEGVTPEESLYVHYSAIASFEREVYEQLGPHTTHIPQNPYQFCTTFDFRPSSPERR